MSVLILLGVVIVVFLFANGPDIIEWFLDVCDRWYRAVRHIKSRRNSHD